MKSLRFEAFSIGLAMFAMFFGAGNIVFPLAVGQFAGDKNLFAIMGLLITAAVMPMAGVIAMILYKGSYDQFFGRMGHFGFGLAVLSISLLGPLGSTPRCIALAYSTVKNSVIDIPPIVFSAAACALIFLLTVNKRYILTLLSWVLTPGLLISLIYIIIAGLATASEAPVVDSTNLKMFLYGLGEGYNTMDLLAAFFFSSTIINLLKLRSENGEANFKVAIQASIIGASLLAIIYIGFSYIASFHAAEISTAKDEILSAITLKIAGPYAGILVCVAIALACLTTAIALISAFTDFVHREIFKEKMNEKVILIASLALTFFVSTFEFTGISAFLWPILQICYPGLIVLTFLNILHRLTGLKLLKLPVSLTFGSSTLAYFFV